MTMKASNKTWALPTRSDARRTFPALGKDPQEVSIPSFAEPSMICFTRMEKAAVRAKQARTNAGIGLTSAWLIPS
jgi:hypothetical protein